MQNSDAFSWYMEADPLLRSTVVAVLIFDGTPDWDLVPERIDRATRLAPGYRHKVVPPPLRLGTPRWTVDPDFDLSWHVRRFVAPPPKNLEMVLEFARKEGMAAFDKDRPLWKYTFFEGLEGDRTALVMKVHHALTDGVGGMDVMRLLFDRGPESDDLGPMPPAPVGENMGVLDLVQDALGHDWSQLYGFARSRVATAIGDVTNAVRHPRSTVAEAIETGTSIARVLRPVSDTLSPVMTERHLTWHYDVLEVPLAGMLDAAHTAGVKHNDAFLSGVTAGLDRYHARHGEQPEELRVIMPVSIRKDHHPIGGNRITLMRFRLPVSVADPVERMRQTRERCEPIKNDKSLPYTQAIAGTLNLLPRGYVGGMLKHIDFLASNVPGVPEPFYLAGAKVEKFYGFGPTIGSALNVTLMTYCGTCLLAVNMDAGAIPDPDVFMDCLREGFEEILAVAGFTDHVVLPVREA
jgi:WS/DGAT/MGAT family acyltransferase